jgi:predicted transposase/invertase (TIGR01784 family)
MINPKSHDSLFKWLITAFTEEFFGHYFPDIKIGKYTFIDKEFISRYEALKESLKGDLFMAMEAEIDGAYREIVIQIEHKSEREDVSERVYEYSCYAWLLKRKPVWSIVIYTDEAIWRKSVADSFWYAFDSRNGKQHHYFDVIKVKTEKSSELIRKHSLMCRLLALKADDRGTDPEELIREIYRAASEMKEKLTDEQLLLLEQWVAFYKKVPEQSLENIKKEVNMEFVETTISEHIFNQGMLKGISEGEARGKAEGRRESAANLLKIGIDMKIITQATGLSEEEIKKLV